MKKSEQYLDRMSKARPRSVTAVLTFAVTLVAVALATPSAQAQTFTLLYSFQGAPQDGMTPNSELVFDMSGNLYGTTYSGGTSANGTVFELDSSGKETVLHNFAGGSGDGEFPTGAIVRYAGNLYGTTIEGGGTGCSGGCGTVFELSRGKETVLYSFSEIGGNFPNAGLVRDTSGNLYGSTFGGSIGMPTPACGTQGCGTVFELRQGQEVALYGFAGTPDGANPEASLITDGSRNLYGTTGQGGLFNQGTVFELSPNPDGTWTEHLLYSFRGKTDGGVPTAGVVMDLKGNLYGTAQIGGRIVKGCRSGCGVVFKLAKNSAGTWVERTLYTFGASVEDGKNPCGNLVIDKRGNIYGTTLAGGVPNDGTVFKVDAAGKETLLHTFAGAPTDGASLFTGLTIDASGDLYGTTQRGGTSNFGTVFKITPQ